MESTVKVWLTKENFSRIQAGNYPTEFSTVAPKFLSQYVEMSVGINTLTEWVAKHRSESAKSSGKTILND